MHGELKNWSFVVALVSAQLFSLCTFSFYTTSPGNGVLFSGMATHNEKMNNSPGSVSAWLKSIGIADGIYGLIANVYSIEVHESKSFIRETI